MKENKSISSGNKATKEQKKAEHGTNERIEEMNEREYKQRQKREHDIEHERQLHEETF